MKQLQLKSIRKILVVLLLNCSRGSILVEGKLVDLDVLGIVIKDVVVAENGVLYTTYEGKGRPTQRPSWTQVKTKTLRQLLALNFYLRKAELNPIKMSVSVLANIIQALGTGNRQTSMDYAKTLFTLYNYVQSDAPHAPKTIEK